MEARNCYERILSRIFHVTLTTGIVLILVLKNTGSVNSFFFSVKLLGLKYITAVLALIFYRTKTSLFKW